jgi:hypothetical protein
MALNGVVFDRAVVFDDLNCAALQRPSPQRPPGGVRSPIPPIGQRHADAEQHYHIEAGEPRMKAWTQRELTFRCMSRSQRNRVVAGERNDRRAGGPTGGGVLALRKRCAGSPTGNRCNNPQLLNNFTGKTW